MCTVRLLIRIRFFVISVCSESEFIMVYVRVRVRFRFAAQLSFDQVSDGQFSHRPFRFKGGGEGPNAILRRADLRHRVQLDRGHAKVDYLAVHPQLRFVVFVYHDHRQGEVTVVSNP